MSRFRPTEGGGASAKFTRAEASILAGLARQVAGVIDARDDLADDPVVDRLFPDAYRGDDPMAVENSAEFRRFTQDELGDQKIHNALIVAEQLDPETRSDNDRKRIRIELDALAVQVWLRAINDMRLSLGVRLGIDDDGKVTEKIDDSQFLFLVFTWLGSLQYSLVRAIDR